MPDETRGFNQVVRPLLSENCYPCHGPDTATRAADLRLDNEREARRVTDRGEDGQILLLQRVLSTDPDEIMPPPEAGKSLTVAEKKMLVDWVESGAPWKQHWSFMRPESPPVPATSGNQWCQNPIDTFILSELHRQGLEPNPAAEPGTLARRLCFDLTGLPPTLYQIRDFETSCNARGMAAAVNDFIDELMASPLYAEHMSLGWLEAARYADTDGYQNDRYRYQHAWRDWVLKAFNEKMPYDQFVIEQLAGDLLPAASLWQQVATGFCRNHRINSEDGSIPEEWRVEYVADRVDTLGTVFLGLTMGCARCHDHKYDPISQREYYQLFAFFNNVAEHGVGPNNGNSPPFIELPASWPIINEADDKALVPAPVELRAARKDAGNGLQRPQAGEPNTVMVMHDLPQPRMTFRLLRGQYNLPDTSEKLLPAIPTALATITSTSPGNRLDLARWLVDGKNPLTSRVYVNRLWQQVFGRGIVETSENLGAQGSLPSHPELLDWLALELEQSGWNIQHVQRLICTSATYQQSSDVPDEKLRSDPENRWLARAVRSRLPGFVLRDQALAFAGLLVNRIGGPSVKPYMPPEIWSSISNNTYDQDAGESLFRRSLYTYWRRTIPPPTMVNFNAAPREVCIVRTEVTNTPLQALTLLNNVTFVEAARCMAERIASPENSTDECVVALFELATGRKPEAVEQDVLRHSWQMAHRYYLEHPDAANDLLAVGESPRVSQIEVTKLAALTNLALTILNLDEVICKE